MPQSIVPMINGVLHSWASIQINVMGRTLVGVTAIKYGSKHNKENIYGAGDNVIGRGYGNKEADPTVLELLQYEIVGLQQAATSAGLTDIFDIPPFDIIVNYAPVGGQGSVTDIVPNCQFVDNGRDWKQGDTTSKIQMNLINTPIKFQQ